MKRKGNLLLLVFFIGSTAVAQDYKFRYFFDENFNSVSEEKAVITGKGFLENGLIRLDCFSKQTGNRVISAHFADSSLSQLQGNYVAYHKNGVKEKEGFYGNGVEWGVWQQWDSSGRQTDSILYQKATALAFTLKEYHANNQLSVLTVSSRDSVFSITVFDTAGRKTGELISKDRKSFYSEYMEGKLVRSVPAKPKDYLPSVSGGPEAFTDHIRKNLNPEVPVNNKAPEGTYKVMIRFMITQSGEIIDLVPETNFGYGMEEEAMRVIGMKTQWKPASINGINIHFLLRQPITFVISSN